MRSNQLQKIAKAKIWKFFGGIKPNELKTTSSERIVNLKLPSIICLPLDKHLGKDGEILVNVGEYVKKGQPLTHTEGRLVPVHASTSGTITSISQEILPHPSCYKGLCITIKPDGLDEEYDKAPIHQWKHLTSAQLLERIHDFGVEGLGGAQFQTDVKLRSAIDESKNGCNVLIINGCECEPAITCDDRIMQENASDIALGIQIVKKILNPKITIVAIEDNKQDAIKAMQLACEGVADIRVLPTVYPSGAGRNLIKIITGIEIPYNEHTSECGIVVNNVGTILSVKEAVYDGVPVTSRVITVTGDSMKTKGNVRVRLGTSVRFVLSNFGLNPEFQQRIILGGPMMGFTLPIIDVPITKSCNCVLAPTVAQIPKLKQPTNCIQCGRCARVCPSRLVPYQMYNQSKAKNHAACLKAGIKDCTLCGSCSFVCPSNIELTSQFRYEQAVERHIREAEKRNERAKLRMQAKQDRLAKEELERQAKKAAALEKMKAQKELEASMSPEELAAYRQKTIEEAKAKARERKAAMLAKTEIASDETSDLENIKKLKTIEQKAIEVAKHHGFVKNTVLKESPVEEKKAVVIDDDAESMALPDSLRKQAGIRTDCLHIVEHQAVDYHVDNTKLVGLEHDESRTNPVQKKKIASVLQSAQEIKEESNILPQALRKKTLRAKR